MDLDIDYLKNLLDCAKKGKFKVNNDEFNTSTNGIDDYQTRYFGRITSPTSDIEKVEKNELEKFHYHLKILFDNNFLYGEMKAVVIGEYPYFKILGLTLQGHQFLEATENKPLIEKITKSIKSISLSTIEKIPALAVGALLQGALK